MTTLTVQLPTEEEFALRMRTADREVAARYLRRALASLADPAADPVPALLAARTFGAVAYHDEPSRYICGDVLAVGGFPSPNINQPAREGRRAPMPYTYWIEFGKGFHCLEATTYRWALREARAWQRIHQAAYATLCGPRGGRRRI